MNQSGEYASVPLASPMKRFNGIYFVLIPVGAIAFGLMGSLTGLLIGTVIGWAAAYLVMQFIAYFRNVGLNWKEYALPANLTYDILLAQLPYCKLHHDFRLEINGNSAVFIFKNTSIHRIRVHKSSHTYSIISRFKVGNFITKRHNLAVKEYTYAYTAVPQIKQVMDEAIAILSQSSAIDQTVGGHN